MDNVYKEFLRILKIRVSLLSKKYMFDKIEALEHVELKTKTKQKGQSQASRQSQAHGFIWENEIRVKVFDLPPCSNDTKKDDIPSDKNKFDTNETISVKTAGGNSIDCGDILRFYDCDFTKKNTIILLKYTQKNDDVKALKEILELNYTKEIHSILFGTIKREILEEYVQQIKAIPKGNVSPEINKEYLEKKAFLQKEYSMRIAISPKVDSETQRRVQCSLTRLDKFIKTYPQFILSRTNEPVLRGCTIEKEIESGRRKRNKKEEYKE
jgi:hypothetical protein